MRDRLAERLSIIAPSKPSKASPLNRYLVERALLDVGGEAERSIVRMLGDVAKPEIASARAELTGYRAHPTMSNVSLVMHGHDRCLSGVLSDAGNGSHRVTDWLDSILTHRVFGLVIFAAFMMLIFQCIYAWSGIPMDGIKPFSVGSPARSRVFCRREFYGV